MPGTMTKLPADADWPSAVHCFLISDQGAMRLFALQLLTENRLSTASDVYSFGIIMYEMLTWLLPFSDQKKEQVGESRTAWH